MDRGAWQATVHGGHKQLDMTEHAHTHATLSTLNQTNPGPEDVDWLSQAGRSLGWRFQVSAARNPLQQLAWVYWGRRDLGGLHQHVWYPHYDLRDTGKKSKKISPRPYYLWRLKGISFSPNDFKLFYVSLYVVMILHNLFVSFLKPWINCEKHFSIIIRF